jgi:hypothetical protein
VSRVAGRQRLTGWIPVPTYVSHRCLRPRHLAEEVQPLSTRCCPRRFLYHR